MKHSPTNPTFSPYDTVRCIHNGAEVTVLKIIDETHFTLVEHPTVPFHVDQFELVKPGPKIETSGKTRQGFTLIELLVVITILTILVSITAASMSWSADKDRVPQASNEIASFVMGARDRAIHSKRQVGVRFFLNQNGPTNVMGNPATVTSMIYIGQGQPVTGKLAIDMNDGQTLILWETGPDGAVGERGVDDDGFGVDDDGDMQIDEPDEQDNHTDELGNGDDIDGSVRLVAFESLGLIKDGAEISIKKDGDAWMTFRVEKAGTNWRLTAPVAWRNSGYLPSFVDLEYSLTVEPMVLPEQSPRDFARGVCIDLEASLRAGGIPSTWHDPGTRQYLTMDIMFDGRGLGTREWVGFGLCNLVIAESADVEKTDYLANPLQAFYSLSQRPKAGQERVVSINPTTGRASVSQLFLDDADSDGVPDDPFRYAEEGKAAK